MGGVGLFRRQPILCDTNKFDSAPPEVPLLLQMCGAGGWSGLRAKAGPPDISTLPKVPMPFGGRRRMIPSPVAKILPPEPRAGGRWRRLPPWFAPNLPPRFGRWGGIFFGVILMALLHLYVVRLVLTTTKPHWGFYPCCPPLCGDSRGGARPVSRPPFRSICHGHPLPSGCWSFPLLAMAGGVPFPARGKGTPPFC